MRFGIRGWRLDKEGHLVSTNFDYIWALGPLSADHRGASVHHRLDACQAHQCGFYSYSSLEAAEKSTYLKNSSVVMGVVVIGGVIEEALVESAKYELEGLHYRYRSEKAMIVALCDDEAKPYDGGGGAICMGGIRLGGQPRKPCPELYPPARICRIQRAELKAFASMAMADPGFFGVM